MIIPHGTTNGEVVAAAVVAVVALGCCIWLMLVLELPAWSYPAFGLLVISAGLCRTDAGNGVRFTSRDCGIKAVAEGRKGAGAGAEWFDQNLCKLPSASPRRKVASAMIAKIPLPLSRHIAAVFLPRGGR